MKSLKDIQNLKLDGDYELIGQALGQSPNTVKSKVFGYRRDTNDMVAKAFTILFKSRNDSREKAIEKIHRLVQHQQAKKVLA